MTNTKLLLIALDLVALIDSGAKCSLSDASNAVDAGTVFELLDVLVADEDFIPSKNIGRGRLDETDRSELVDRWQRYSNAYEPGPDAGVRNNGLCVLLAYVLWDLQRADSTRA